MPRGARIAGWVYFPIHAVVLPLTLGMLLLAVLGELPSDVTCNVRLSYDLRIYKEITLQLYGGVQNLFNAYQKDFDKGADRDSGYIYGPSLPRSWFVGAKFSF